MTIRSRFPDYAEAVTSPIGRFLARSGITPNWITTFGLILTGFAAWAVANDMPAASGLLLIAGGLMDTFDGAVARATNRSTPFGGFYDSVSDRISDGVILAGVAWWVSDEPRLFLLVATAFIGSQVTSYVRAKAESIDLVCGVGILERAERAVLLILALLFHRWLLEPVLWLLAVGSVVTVIQRIHHVWCQIDRDLPEEIIALTLQDRAWSRAFTSAARRFYGERNFDGALDEWTLDARAATERLDARAEPRPQRDDLQPPAATSDGARGPDLPRSVDPLPGAAGHADRGPSEAGAKADRGPSDDGAPADRREHSERRGRR